MRFKSKPPSGSEIHGTPGAVVPASSRIVFGAKKDIAHNETRHAKAKIMVIDDDLLVMKVLLRVLEKGYDIAHKSTTHSADEAIALIEKENPSLVLTDLNFDNTGKYGAIAGGHLAKMVKERLPGTKVILVSDSLPVLQTQRPDLPAYLDGVVEKPFTLEQLLGAVAAALGAKKDILPSETRINKPSMVIIDDEEALVKSGTAIMRDDFDVVSPRTATRSLEAAKKLIESFNPSVILTDMSFEFRFGTDGYELCKWAKERNPLAVTALVTGNPNPLYSFLEREGLRQSQWEGEIAKHVDFFVQKPYRASDLIGMITEKLAERK